MNAPVFACQNPAASVSEKKSLSSSLVSRNVTVMRHRTSVRLEPEMWDGLREICNRERVTIHELCSSVSAQKAQETSLTAAIRVFVMRYFRVAATEDGHLKAGHSCGKSSTVGVVPPLNGVQAHMAGRQASAVLTKTSFA